MSAARLGSVYTFQLILTVKNSNVNRENRANVVFLTEFAENMNARMSSYKGSQLFASLAENVGLETDQMNFVMSQIMALLLSTLYRTMLHPSKTSPQVRHTFGLVIGLFMGYFCFGLQAVHLAVLPTVCYLVRYLNYLIHLIMLFVLEIQSPQFICCAINITQTTEMFSELTLMFVYSVYLYKIPDLALKLFVMHQTLHLNTQIDIRNAFRINL